MVVPTLPRLRTCAINQDPATRELQVLLERRARRGFSFSADNDSEGGVASKVAKFKRQAQVAFESAPNICIGEVVSPPTVRNQRTLIRLATGGQKLYELRALVVWQPPAAP